MLVAEFEKITHEALEAGKALTADFLEETYFALNHKYYGDDIVPDALIRAEWSRIPHFYRPFYVYQYATGYAAAYHIAEKLRTEGKVAQEHYLSYLASGGSDYSLNLLRAAGADMSEALPMERLYQKFSLSLDELEQK